MKALLNDKRLAPLINAIYKLGCQILLTGVFWLIAYAMLYETAFK